MQMNAIAVEKAQRERLEKLKQEVDQQQNRNVAKPTNSRPAPVSRPAPTRVCRANAEGRSGANFYPQSSLDHEVLNAYHSREQPDESLPIVPFSRRSEGVFFLGLRKCEIEEHGSTLLVK